jgi:hypothetical protein
MNSGTSHCSSFWDAARARHAVRILGGVVAVLLLSLPTFSQGNFGRIMGTVTDQSGGVVANATVSVVDTERNVSRTMSTDDAGEYNAPNLIPSTYMVRAEAKGFKRIERQGIELGVGKEIRVDLIVQPGQQEQTVTVTESIPLVETTNATLGGTLNNADIQDMPLNGRNYQNLLSLRPGVTTYAGGSPWTQSTNNSRPDESVWMLDGVLNVNLYDYRPISGMPSPFTDGATILPVDAIQEFNLMENPKAEYGWRPGAVVNVGIKSGTNTLHGSAYGFYRSAAWDARNAYNTAEVGGTCLQNPLPVVCNKLPTYLKQFGGVVGGPIKKDKLFFFGGYEGLRSFVGNAFPASVPQTGAGGGVKNSMVDAINGVVTALGAGALSPASLDIFGCSPSGGTYSCTGGLIANAPSTTTGYNSGFPNINQSNNGIGKMDYRVNDKHTINGMVLVGDYLGDGEDHPVVNNLFKNGDPIRTYTVSADWVWTPNSRMVNDARFGWDKVSFSLVSDDQNVFADGTGGLCTASGCGSKGYPLNSGVNSVGGFPTVTIAKFAPLGGWRGRPVQFVNPYYDFQDSVSYLMGKHSFKFGVEYTHIEAFINLHDTRGRFDFLKAGGNAFPGSSALEDFFAGKPSDATLLVGQTARDLFWKNLAGFVQDDWRVTPKLIVNLGLRYSYVSPIRDNSNLLGTFDPTLGMVQQGQSSVGDTLWKADYKDFSPRAGFAWDLSGKGTTVIRGGVSRIYSIFTPAQFMQSPFQNFKNGTIAAVPTGALCTPNVNGCPAAGNYGGSIGLGTAVLAGTAVNWNAPAGSAGALPGGVALSCTVTSGSCFDLTTVSQNLKTPSMTNWSLGITHAITNNLSLEVSYVGNHGSNMTGFVDLNQAPLGAGYCLNALTPQQLAPGTGACNPANPAFMNAGLAEQQARPFENAFPYLRYVNMTVNDARSNYHSLQATLTERVTHGLSFTAGYTFGHGLDNGSLNRFGNLPQDSGNPGLEYGSSDFDIRNRFTITATYDLPSVKGFAQLLEGWKLNTIVSISGRMPWLVNDQGNDISGTGDFGDRWNITGNPGDFNSGPDSFMFCQGSGAGGCGIYSGPYAQSVATCGTYGPTLAGGGGCDANTSKALWQQCLNADNTANPNSTLVADGCFVSGRSVITPPNLGTYGNMGRNIFRDSGFKNVDFSVFKIFTFKERYSAEFRAEVFNLFNHPIISNPYGAANGGLTGNDPSSGVTFGCGCGTPDVVAGNPLVGSGSSRVLQVGLKLAF